MESALSRYNEDGRCKLKEIWGCRAGEKEKNKTQATKKQCSSLPLPNGINTQINSVRIDEILPKGYESQVHKHHILKS